MKEEVNYNRIKSALEFIAANYKKQPGMNEIAEHIHLSEFHFQRIFKEWSGITPKKFLRSITFEELKKNIETTENLAELSESTGLSSPSRIYDLFVDIESVTPEEYKTKGKGIEIRYGIHETPFGKCLLANTKRGICALEFADEEPASLVQALKEKWQNATFEENQHETGAIIDTIFGNKKQPLKALLYGTNFQVKVWEALIKIPYGKFTSYSSVVEMLGRPNASRAVGTAIGKNNIALLIPCHRVIQQIGGIGGYKWGVERKLAIIGYEKSMNENKPK